LAEPFRKPTVILLLHDLDVV